MIGEHKPSSKKSNKKKEKIMKSGKKVIVALSTLCAVCVIALVTVISVWAATSQTVKSSFSINYKAKNVAATVKADYTSELKSEGTVWTAYGDGAGFTFTTHDTNEEKEFTSSEIEVEAKEGQEQTYVLFRFTFTNNGGNKISVSLDKSQLTDGTNLTIKYSHASADPTAITEISGSELAQFTVDTGATVYAYVLFQVTNDANNASLTGSLTWTLENSAAA